MASTSATLTQLSAYAREQTARGEPRWQRDLDGFSAVVSLAAGRYVEAASAFLRAGRADPMNASSEFGVATLAALLGADISTAREALTALEGTGKHGPIVKLERRRAAAGIAALEGRPEEALSGFRSVQEELRRMELPYPLAQTNLAMCIRLDPSLPEVSAAADEARGIFERLEARAWLDRLDEALARDGDPIISATRSHPSSASTPTPTA